MEGYQKRHSKQGKVVTQISALTSVCTDKIFYDKTIPLFPTVIEFSLTNIVSLTKGNLYLVFRASPMSAAP